MPPRSVLQARVVLCLSLCATTASFAQSPAGPNGDAKRPPKPPQTSEEFDRAWRSLLSATGRGEWKGVKKKIEALLDDHRDADYVRLRRDDVVMLHRMASFREKSPPPDPKTLVTGKLVDWAPRSGRIKIEYRPETMGDWTTRREGKVDVFIHPAGFSGPHSLEIKVADYPTARRDAPVPGILLCAGEKSALTVSYGLAHRAAGGSDFHAPAAIVRTAGGERHVLVSSDEEALDGGPATLRVTAAEDVITAAKAAQDGSGFKKLLSSAKKRDEWGAVAFFGFPSFERLTLEGKCEPSWIQGLVDKADAEARKEFEAGYEAKTSGLPEWLFAPRTASRPASRGAAEADRALTRRLPDELTAEQRATVSRIERLEPDDAQAELAKLKADALPPATRALLSGEARAKVEDHDGAIPEFRAAAKAAPTCVRAWRGLAEALVAVKRSDEAADAATKAAALAPTDAEVALLAATSLFLAGRPADAKRARETALAAGAKSIALEMLGPILARAAFGPEWPRKETVVSDHYEIMSDLDRPTCEAAAKVLEQSFEAFEKFVGRPKGKSALARVLLFSGEDGYRRYSVDVTGGMPMQTAGMYSPVVKQLLIWNLPTRDAMFRTVRHEGLHQHLDRLMRDPPVWFNEGLAVYFETVRLSNGTWLKGEARKDLLRRLARPAPIRDFVTLKPKEFYAGAESNYPEAWSVVHCLLHGGPETKQLYDAYFKALTSGASSERATAEVFSQQTLNWFEPFYGRYLTKLAE